MIASIASPKWQDFQDSLARLIKVTIAVLDRSGSILSVHNAYPPLAERKNSPVLFEAYTDFCREVGRSGNESGAVFTTQDPLGLAVAVIPLGSSGPYVVLSGGVDRSNPDARTDFEAALNAYGVMPGRLWETLPFITMDQLQEKAARVEPLYSQLYRSVQDTGRLGQQMMLLAAVGEINKLMISLFTPECFDLPRILELVASSLIISSDAEGAWVFSKHGPLPPTIVYRGMCTDFLEDLGRHWHEALNNGEDLELVVARLQERGRESGYRLVVHSLEREEYCALIGSVNPVNEFIEQAMSAFRNQVAIALQVATLYEVIRDQVGIILNSIGDGTIVFNRDGRAMVVNRVAVEILERMGVEAVVGQPVEECGLSRSMELAVRSAIMHGGTYSRRREDSGDVYLSWQINPIQKEGGTIAGAVLVLQDITETEELRCRIQDWERLATAGEVAASLAHEIRNPLSAAVGAIQLLEYIQDEPKRKEILDKLSAELGRMNRVLTDFLNVAGPNTDRTVSKINLAHVIGEVEFLIRGEAHLNDIELVMKEPPPELPLVLGERDSLKQVLLNVAKNAVEAMTEGGCLEISLTAHGQNVSLIFRDNGPGITEDNLQNVFRPFFTTKLAGTGLGLVVSLAIVKRMGGEIHLTSEVGKGTTVEIVLPVYTKSRD